MKEKARTQADIIKKMNDMALKGEVVIFGSTYMSRFPFYELLKKCMLENAVYNRSIEGLTVSEAIEIADDCVVSLEPGKLFISLGEEDEDTDDVLEKYRMLVAMLRSKLPECELYLIGIVGEGKYRQCFNNKIMSLCDGERVQYINFVSKGGSEASLYKARFKQLTHYFRDRNVTMSEAFAIAEI